MKLATAALVAVVVGFGLSPSLLAQKSDGSVERIAAALQRQSQLSSSVPTWTQAPPKKLGIVTFVSPMEPGEMIRLRLPIGELVTNAARAILAANQKRRESSARHEVQKALSAFIAQQ